MVFTDAEIAYLTSQKLGRLATKRPDGTLQNSPVGFAYNVKLEAIDIGGYDMAPTVKFKNVADNGEVAFVVDDLESVNPWKPRALEIRGRGEAIADPMDSASQFPGAIIRIRPRRIISHGIDTENPSMDGRNV
jgi:pyridoxamine 5'-phosphate oxidase family protein